MSSSLQQLCLCYSSTRRTEILPAWGVITIHPPGIPGIDHPEYPTRPSRIPRPGSRNPAGHHCPAGSEEITPTDRICMKDNGYTVFKSLNHHHVSLYPRQSTPSARSVLALFKDRLNDTRSAFRSPYPWRPESCPRICSWPR